MKYVVHEFWKTDLIKTYGPFTREQGEQFIKSKVPTDGRESWQLNELFGPDYSIYVAKVPGITLNGYMIAIAEDRVTAVRLINEGRRIQIPSEAVAPDVKAEDLIRLSIQEGYQLIWNGDY